MKKAILFFFLRLESCKVKGVEKVSIVEQDEFEIVRLGQHIIPVHQLPIICLSLALATH